ncbi:uncharacterized protein LOC144120023 [Amblyomma americanum]
MSTSSPGQGNSPWSASLPPNQLPLDAFFRGGVGTIPVALVPSDGGAIRINNPDAVQTALQAITPHFLKICDVRQYGRGGVVCRSADQACIMDLLTCTAFGSQSVSAFIPPHLACTKGLVRGVDPRLNPKETLEELSSAGVISVHRCTRVVEETKLPTETVIATFVGLTCPSELKVWPLVFRVDPYSSRPLQCRNCWRFGHSANACKSSSRCSVCGGNHDRVGRCSKDEMCCLCSGSHSATYSNCPARAEEVKVLEVLEKRRCSRREAMAIVKERTYGYSSGAARQTTAVVDSSLSDAIAAAVEKAMAKVMDRLVTSVTECISQVMVAQMTSSIMTSNVALKSSVDPAVPTVFSSDYVVVATQGLEKVFPFYLLVASYEGEVRARIWAPAVALSG